MRPQQTVAAEQALPAAQIPTPAPPGAVPHALTGREVSALREQRAELSRQLSSAEDRRARLAESLKGTEGEARQGILQRIEVLDKRMVQIESDIAETGRQLSNSPRDLVATTESAPRILGLEEENFMGLAGGFTALVLFPLALAYARLIWKRATVRTPPRDAEADRRLERIEQAIDSIAIEVERVSENQRYTTKVLSEANPFAALPAGQAAAEPIRVPNREAVRASHESA